MNCFNSLWPELLSGLIGAILGSVITAFASYKIIKVQVRIESNRTFIERLIRTLQTVQVNCSSRSAISAETLNEIISFQAVKFKEFDVLDTNLNALKQNIYDYQNRFSDFLKSTSTSPEENDLKAQIIDVIKKIMEDIYKIT